MDDTKVSTPGSSDDHSSEQRHVSDEEKAAETHTKHEEKKDEERRQLTGIKVQPVLLLNLELNRVADYLQWFLFVSSTLTSIFLYALDNTIVANIVPVGLDQRRFNIAIWLNY